MRHGQTPSGFLVTRDVKKAERKSSTRDDRSPPAARRRANWRVCV
jgi:hypothetical protein